MKSFLILTVVALTSLTTFASKSSATAKTPNCANEAVYAAVAKNYKTFEAGTNSCGIKALNVGSNLETYIVCTTDETDPMEYIVTINPLKQVDGKPAAKCAVEYVAASHESATPTFESADGLIKDAQVCSIEYGEAVINCK